MVETRKTRSAAVTATTRSGVGEGNDSLDGGQRDSKGGFDDFDTYYQPGSRGDYTFTDYVSGLTRVKNEKTGEVDAVKNFEHVVFEGTQKGKGPKEIKFALERPAPPTAPTTRNSFPEWRNGLRCTPTRWGWVSRAIPETSSTAPS